MIAVLLRSQLPHQIMEDNRSSKGDLITYHKRDTNK